MLGRRPGSVHELEGREPHPAPTGMQGQQPASLGPVVDGLTGDPEHGRHLVRRERWA
jgi:hypothetical protein